MIGWRRFIFGCVVCVNPQIGLAQDVRCSGTDPNWSLEVSGNTAFFNFQRSSELQVMQDDVDLNSGETRGLTIVGARDSGIVILGPDQSATVLTQRGETPIILTGRCE